jgi:hypothetical protein
VPGSGSVATKRCATTMVSMVVEGGVEATPVRRVGLQLDVINVVDRFTCLENTLKRKVTTRVAVRYLSDPNARQN